MSIALQEIKLRKWIAARLVVPPAPVAFRLFHVGQVDERDRQQVTQLATVKVAELDGSPSSAEGEGLRLARELWQAHQDHVEPLEGLPQFYQVFAFHRTAEGKLKRGPMHHWRTQHGELVGAHLSASEPATDRGSRAQQMRHNEMLVRSIVEMASATYGTYKSIVEEQRGLIEHLMSGHLDSLKAAEEMISEKHLRDVATADFVASQERKGEAWKKIVDNVAPEIGAAVRGFRKLPPKPAGVPKNDTTPATSPAAAAEASSSSSDPSSSSMSRDEKATLRRILYGLPDDMADKLMEGLGEADRQELLTIVGSP